uniref:50S ribosomal protein L9, chloroplastic n=1 Tax=Globisporangium ultimum (strain ATCC 200006 / CBS 805.95 / DAOM BR144) TaxID=431595 RepID=K3X919_GLOUD
MLAASFKRVASQIAKRDGASMLSRAFGHRVSMVLKQDVANLGFRGEEVSVKAGYARNFLYPEKLAVYATEANLEKYKVNKESVDEADAEKERALKQIISRLSSVEVVFKRHTASKAEQTLHSSVTAQNISDMLEKQHGIIVGVARINLPTPIKTLGSHSVKVRVDDEVEKEYAAGLLKEGGEAPAVAAADVEEEDAAKGASKKKEVKLQVLVTRR